MNIRPTEIVLIPREQATLGRVDFRGVVTDEAAEIKSGDLALILSPGAREHEIRCVLESDDPVDCKKIAWIEV